VSSSSPPTFIDRDRSWLRFNARVLARASAPTVPLLEQVKFLAIFSSNLDEFFQVRVAGLKEQIEAGLGRSAWEELTTNELLGALRHEAAALVSAQYARWGELSAALRSEGIEIVSRSMLTREEREYADTLFDERVFPVLTPLSVDPSHPFPYVSNLSLNLATVVRDPESKQPRFARLKMPPLLSRFTVLPSGRFLPLEQLIAPHLEDLFPGMFIEGSWAFRVTRNADLSFDEDEADDLLSAVELELRRRRFGEAVRLEVAGDMPDDVRELLRRELELDEQDVYAIDGPLDLTGLFAVVGAVDRPDLRDPPFNGVTQRRLNGVAESGSGIFRVLRERDVLVHHPYDSFAISVEAFVEQAANDPSVLAIKQTLYRTSGGAIVKSLMRAAEQGKQVVALVELKARFDEEANITWARALEEAGVHVVYGVAGLKTHAKVVLVVREEREGLRRYCHVGTGNYNSSTARLYEDLGVLSADPVLGEDLTDLFNYLTGYSRQQQFERIVVAPSGARGRLFELIEAEAERPDGRIVIKANSIADREMVEALYEASQRGVSIDMIVRGICCLRPGVAGLSDNINVRSLVGRYLEHSRVYSFGRGDRQTVLIGSADLMTRNLDRRVEVLLPVTDPAHVARLNQVLEFELSDTTLAWELQSSGEYVKVGGDEFETHVRLQEAARARTGRVRMSRDQLIHDVGSREMVRAAGGVIWRPSESGTEILLVHRPSYDDWSFPKGKVEPGEDDLEAAVREVLEETGFECRVGPELPAARYLDHRGRPKEVRYWAMEPTAGEFAANEEIDAVAWLSRERASELLTYDGDREVLAALSLG
jgi:polyphosphate kinase